MSQTCTISNSQQGGIFFFSWWVYRVASFKSKWTQVDVQMLEASKVLPVDDVMLAMSIYYIQSRLKTLGWPRKTNLFWCYLLNLFKNIQRQKYRIHRSTSTSKCSVTGWPVFMRNFLMLKITFCMTVWLQLHQHRRLTRAQSHHCSEEEKKKRKILARKVSTHEQL